MKKRFLIETEIITSSKDVIDNTLEYLSVDVDECQIVESRILKIEPMEIERLKPLSPIEHQELVDIEWLCPKCKCTVGNCVKVDNFCHNCGQKIKFN